MFRSHLYEEGRSQNLHQGQLGSNMRAHSAAIGTYLRPTVASSSCGLSAQSSFKSSFSPEAALLIVRFLIRSLSQLQHRNGSSEALYHQRRGTRLRGASL